MSMKPYHAVIVFVLIWGSAALSSLHSYQSCKTRMVQDMNQALALTLENHRQGALTPDTIREYRSHLKTAILRERSFIYYATDQPLYGLKSKKMAWHGNRRVMEFQSYADCSMASIWISSDQSLPMALTLLGMLWMAFSIHHLRSARRDAVIVGRLCYHPSNHSFSDTRDMPIVFTPMQHRLMQMFCDAHDHRLDKQQICETLWPKKPDASETLYALIARIKPIIETGCRLQIVSDRGRGYRLKPMD